MTLTHTDRVDMLREITEAYVALDRLLATIPDDALEQPATCGLWSGKEVVAHLGNWEDVLREYLIATDNDDNPQWPTANRHTDIVNEEMLEPYRTLSVSDVREQFRDAHFALMDTLESSPSVDVRRALQVTKVHYDKHIDDLRQLIQ